MLSDIFTYPSWRADFAVAERCCVDYPTLVPGKLDKMKRAQERFVFISFQSLREVTNEVSSYVPVGPGEYLAQIVIDYCYP